MYPSKKFRQKTKSATVGTTGRTVRSPHTAEGTHATRMMSARHRRAMGAIATRTRDRATRCAIKPKFYKFYCMKSPALELPRPVERLEPLREVGDGLAQRVGRGLPPPRQRDAAVGVLEDAL